MSFLQAPGTELGNFFHAAAITAEKFGQDLPTFLHSLAHFAETLTAIATPIADTVEVVTGNTALVPITNAVSQTVTTIANSVTNATCNGALINTQVTNVPTNISVDPMHLDIPK